MYLNIILTILVLVLITIFLSIYLWWKNFGKKMFNTMSNMNKVLPKGSNKMINPNNMGNILTEVDKMMKQFKKYKNDGI